MDRGYEWLESIARGMQHAVDNGTAPTLEQLTVRELLDRFGYRRRGDWINSHIYNGLEKYNLIIDCDFVYAWVDSTLTISLAPERLTMVSRSLNSTPRFASEAWRRPTESRKASSQKAFSIKL